MQKVYRLQGIDCPHCAAKVERSVSGIAGVHRAVIDFPNEKLTVDFTGGAEVDAVLADIRAAIEREEPDAELREHANSGGRASESRDFPFGELALACGSLALLILAALLPFHPSAKLAIYLAAWFLSGWKVLFTALRNIARGDFFDENFLMTVASAGAFIIGEAPEGVAVMIFFRVGECFEAYAVGRSRRSIAGLMDIRPDYANLVEDGSDHRVDPSDVRVGDTLLIKPGEKVPLDGVVLTGQSSLDTSGLTGESVPADVGPGSSILSGSVNRSGLLTMRVSSVLAQSTVSKILDLVENASANKSKTEQFITRFARVYTPAVVGAALLLAVLPPLVTGSPFSEWAHRALAFLVVSCPCALVISVPLGFAAGIGRASRNGVLVKGGSYLDALTRMGAIAFDKTGTLTSGRLQLRGVYPAEGVSSDELLKWASLAERSSDHPIARAICATHPAQGSVAELIETAGYGVEAVADGRRVLVGSAAHLHARGIETPINPYAGTQVFVGLDGAFIGVLAVADEIRPGSKPAIQALKLSGIKTVMLSGDSPSAANAVGDALGLDEVHAGLLPQDKVAAAEKIKRALPKDRTLACIGDGLNDAPLLAVCDVGIAMGGVGSQAAVEAADIVFMNDEPQKILTAIEIAHRTRRIVRQNITLALGVKALVLLLSVLGVTSLWAAVFADVGVALIAIVNASR